MNQYNYLFKFILIGNTCVGKSCLLSQFTEGRFKKEHDATIGVEFGSKNILVNDTVIKIQIWDTAGQESFKSITRSYYRGSIGSLLIFDITHKESFDSLQMWLNEVINNANKSLSFIVIGNKIDLIGKRQVTYEEAQQFAKENNFIYIETSALTGENVENAFKQIAEEILNKIQNKEIDPNNHNSGIKVGTKQKFNTQNQNYNENLTLEQDNQTNKKNQCQC
ncbi:hypothetical protein IMG5_116200 [Ichthyophthirius multifiliis]|uniref:Ras family protein n=1 Tax=Ichthyophthirius multifiliis TaxID=5932 RepID=G0QUC2_ICHMU|nr:hypothetical protein IMG5_116200 [Ichthyophthirius multifiliis]EGR31194.1 hypothetical protein IMG5_116200 [Ichthyophthirius multifiliis]|eukprot:XP_004034680.1 hypothetical protein IMG5_116200 [Ichthyophthirius multifiliis]